MSEVTGNHVKLGVVVFISVALFTAGIYFIGQRQQLFGSTFRIRGVFNDISGLQVGNNVRFSGINVGIIELIEQITDTTVRVDMIIDSDSQKFIKKSSKVVIGSEGLMGNKIVVITPGTAGSVQVENNDFIQSVKPINMDDILLKLKVTSDNAAVITTDLAKVTGNISSGRGTVGKLLMDSTFAKTVDDAFVNIKKGAGGFSQNMEAAKGNVLLRGYFKKKERKANEAKEEKEAKNKK